MLFSPGAWLAAFCGLGAILILCHRVRIGRWVCAAGATGFLLIMALPIDQWALAPLENRFPPPPPGQRYDGILVLGGALETAMTADRGRPSLNNAAERLTEFAVMARSHPEARMVFTGGPMPNRPDGPPEAIGARTLLGALGIPPDRVMFEDLSRTTWENAVLARALVGPRPGEAWLLITSANHMPRSIGIFRKMGWDLQAYPVAYKSFLSPAHRATRGFGERLALLDTAAHEWLGLAYYYIQGRTDSLFPAPHPSAP
jgi:uncharacterized SAM-binding protein YcdF (DUF218 family)